MEIPANEGNAVANNKANVIGTQQGKQFNPLILLKMAGIISGKIKNGEKAAEVDPNCLIPFLALLNQQMAQMFPAENMRENAAGDKSEILFQLQSGSLQNYTQLLLQLGKLVELNPELYLQQSGQKTDSQELLLLSILKAAKDGNNKMNENELSALAKMLMETMTDADREELIKNLVAGVVEKDGQIKIYINGKEVTLSLNEHNQLSFNESEVDFLKNILKNQHAGLTAQSAININKEKTAENSLRQTLTGKISETELTSIKPENLAPTENKEAKEKILSEIKNGKNELPDKVIKEFSTTRSDTQAGIAPDTANAKAAENKLTNNAHLKDGLSEFIAAHTEKQSGEENNFNKDQVRFSTLEVKSDIQAKENRQNALNQAKQAAAETLNSANKAQAFLAEINEKIKGESKAKTPNQEKKSEAVSSSLLNATGSSSAKAENIAGVNSSDLISKVALEIKENAVADGGRVKITLNPPSLGTLEMDVIVRNGKVEVVLVANNKDVQQTLNGNIEQLKSSLLNQGLTIERCDVFMQDKHDEFNRFLGSHTYNQDRSGKEGNDGNQEKNNDKTLDGIPVIKNHNRMTEIATDAISLFA